MLWIDTNKGDLVEEHHRNRLVVGEKRCKGDDGRALPATFLFRCDAPSYVTKHCKCSSDTFHVLISTEWHNVK